MSLNINSLNKEEMDVLEILKNVIEPATEVGIIDLGLVYSISIVSNKVIINFTLVWIRNDRYFFLRLFS